MLGSFASRVDAGILAEGGAVEELDALVSLGVPLVQGCCLARPAPPWADIDPDLAHRLASKAPVAHKTVIRDVLEPATTVTSVAGAAEAFADSPALQSVVLLEEHLRPVAVLDPDMPSPGMVSPGMRANLHTALSEALARSMTGEKASRFEPLLVTDNAGGSSGSHAWNAWSRG